MEARDRKRMIIMLRWTAIIVTSCLILFGRGRVTDLYLSYTLIIVYLLSNILLIFLPKTWFSNLKLFYPLVFFDTGIVSFGMYVGEGTGLGLNIVYRIVTKYEGTIDVESKEQVGTTFTIKFPQGGLNHGKESLNRGR